MQKGARYFHEQTRRQLTLGDQIGAGGEASVFHVKEEPAFAAKIYSKPIQSNTLNKLRYMLANPPVDSTFEQSQYYSIAWPAGLIVDSKNTIIGFLMAKIGSAHKLSTIINPSIRTKKGIQYDHRHFYNIAMNLATVVKNIHQKGYVIGDLNTDNFMVSTEAQTLTLMTVIDCDSFQVKDTTGKTYHCLVGKPEYTAPEFQHVTSFNGVDRTQQSDLFALAVIIYQLLMQGSHPFQGINLHPSREIQLAQVHCIKHNIFPHLANSEFKRGPYAPKFTALPRPLQDLFLQAFISGRNYVRPTADMWVQTLSTINRSLTTCASAPAHIHPRNYPCVMCEWEILVGKRSRGNSPELPDLKESALPSAMPAPTRPKPKSDPVAPSPAVVQPPKPPSRKQQATPVVAPATIVQTRPFTKQQVNSGNVTLDQIITHEFQPYRELPTQTHHQHVVATLHHVYTINGRGGVQGFTLDQQHPVPRISRDARNSIALAAGDHHCLALRADGKVFAWGDNEYGQCTVPNTLNNAVAIAANQYYSMALTADHTVVVWGDDDYNLSNIPSTLHTNTRSIAAGIGHCAAIALDGRVITWGNLIHMQNSIDTHFNGKASAVAIAADNDATLILDSNQTLWYFNDEQTAPKKLMIGRDVSTVKFMYLIDTFAFLGIDQNRIQTVDMLKPTKLRYMTTSTPAYHGMIHFYPTAESYIIQTPSHINVINRQKPSLDPRSFAYQSGLASRLSQMITNTAELRFHHLQHIYRQSSHLACGNDYVAVLHNQSIHVFGTLDTQSASKITQIHGHATHLVAIDQQQRASVFGDNSSPASQIPTQIQGRILAVSTYADHSLATLTGDLVGVWGDNGHKQLSYPQVKRMVSVATGLQHSLALLDNGRVVAWGNNKFGQTNVPSDLEDVVQICAGGNLSAALRKDGSICVWGELNPRVASTFDGLTNVAAIALGHAHGAILFNDGSVRTWGQIDPKQPMPPTHADPVIAIACGNGYTTALTMNRRVMAWGSVSLDERLPA